MYKKILLLAPAIFLVACGDSATSDKTSEPIAQTSQELNDIPFKFTSGITDDGGLYVLGDKENKIELEGKCDDVERIYVIENDKVIEVLKVNNDGNFNYKTEGGTKASNLFFTADGKHKVGSKVDLASLNYLKVRFKPNEKYLAAKVESEQSSEESSDEIELDQNNKISMDKWASIKVGMTQAEVVEAIGNPKEINDNSSEIKSKIYESYMALSESNELLPNTQVEEKMKNLMVVYSYVTGTTEVIEFIYDAEREPNDYYDGNIYFVNDVVKYVNSRVDSSGNYEPEPAIDDSAHKIGETVDFTIEDGGSLSVTIDSVTKNYGDDWHTPVGVFYAEVHFTISNTGSDELEFNSHEWELYDSGDLKAELDSWDYYSESIKPGKASQGVAYFDITTEGDTFELFFADTSWQGTYQQ